MNSGFDHAQIHFPRQIFLNRSLPKSSPHPIRPKYIIHIWANTNAARYYGAKNHKNGSQSFPTQPVLAWDEQRAGFWPEVAPGSLFEISVIWLRAGPTRSENSSGPGRLGRKFLRAARPGDFKHWSRDSDAPAWSLRKIFERPKVPLEIGRPTQPPDRRPIYLRLWHRIHKDAKFNSLLRFANHQRTKSRSTQIVL